MSASSDLFDLVRQLRAELEWAQRTGIVPEAPRDVARESVSASAPLPVSEPEAPREPTHQEARKPTTLEAVRTDLGDCRRCKLSGGRTNIVFGVGSETAELMFIGEGPGADEDRLGEPFVGKAGQLLTKIIGAMGYAREDVYIANVVKCRPPQNRDPEPDEVEACEPFLRAQIEVIQPKVIVTLGRWASQTILRSQTPITRMRGKWSEYNGIPVMPTYHPAYLLRNPAEKRPVWEDMKEILRFMGRDIPERGGRQ